MANPSIPTLDIAVAIGSASLIGATAGRLARPALLAAAEKLPLADWSFVDLSGMDVVTASAAREAVLPLCVHLVERRSLSVLTGMNAAVLDEVTFAALAGKRTLVIADGLRARAPKNPRIVGHFDDKLSQTLRLVAEVGEADAKSVSERSKDEAVVTAWNNRLSTLASMRLLRERKVGKTKFYSLVLEGLAHGH